MLKRSLIFFSLVSLTIILAISCNSKKRTEKAEMDELFNDAAISELAKRYNADNSWQKTLAKGDDSSFANVLTIELEKYWLIDGPIIFMGSIRDIRSEDLENYRIIVSSPWPNSILTTAGIQLSLVCPRPIIDLFLKEHPDYFNGLSQVFNRVALVADIDKIGIGYDDRIGIGKCLDLLFIEDPSMKNGYKK